MKTVTIYDNLSIAKWQVCFYNKKVSQVIQSMPPKLQARFFCLVDRMKIVGPYLGMPHTKAMGDHLFELRIKAENGIMRGFYCIKVKYKIVFLHCFVKQSQKTPVYELELAKRRLKEVFKNER